MSQLHRTTRTTAAAAILIGLSACGPGDAGLTDPGPAQRSPEQVADLVPNLETVWVSNTWVTRSQLTSSRLGAVAATVNGAIYLIGGQGDPNLPNIPALSTVQQYFPDGDLVVWVNRTPMPSGRAYASGAAVINGKIYVPGGVVLSTSASKSLYVYNPGTNSWAQKADSPVPTAWGASGVINGKLYVFTPRIYQTPPRLYRYDPSTNTWTKRADPPRDHRQPAAGVIDGKFYLAGGSNLVDGKTQTAALDVYDPGTNTWTTRKAMPTARYGAVAVVLNGKLYVAGGRSNYTALGALEAYNPATNGWAQKPSMPTPRYDLAVAKVNGALYAMGGYGTTALRTNEAYKP